MGVPAFASTTGRPPGLETANRRIARGRLDSFVLGSLRRFSQGRYQWPSGLRRIEGSQCLALRSPPRGHRNRPRFFQTDPMRNFANAQSRSPSGVG